MAKSRSTVKAAEIPGVSNGFRGREPKPGKRVEENNTPRVVGHVIAGLDSLRIFRADPQERISTIRRGIPAASITALSGRMGMSKENLLSSLGLPRATISRKERDGALLSSDESERILGMEMLIGMVQSMVEESGDPTGFNAARWVSEWLTKPLPALAGETPASYMDTNEGRKLVAELLSMSQSGAYA